MSAYIKLVNEENKTRYDTPEDIENIIGYIYSACKCMYDDIRPGHMLGEYMGCAHFFGTEEQEKQPENVIWQMFANNIAYGKDYDNLIKHRIIGFDNTDCFMPNEAFQLARYIANAYGENYITAYAVHVDTKNIHIHLAIDTISWRDGSRFSVSFEIKWIRSIVERWLEWRNRKIINDWEWNIKSERYYGIY